MKRGTQVQDAVGEKLDQSSVVESQALDQLKVFRIVQETVTQDKKLAIECTYT